MSGTGGEYRRAELRSSAPTANPYIAFALLIYAGLCGIEHQLQVRTSVLIAEYLPEMMIRVCCG